MDKTTKKTKNKTDQPRRFSLKVVSKEKEPPFPAETLAEIEDAVSDWLNKNDGVALAEKCSGAFCLGKVNTVKELFAAVGVNLRCRVSKCSWEYRDRRWVRVCSLDCSTPGGRLVVGEVT